MQTLSEISARMSEKAELIQKIRESSSQTSAAWQAADAVKLLARAVKSLVDTLGDDVELEIIEAVLRIESAQAAAYVAAVKHHAPPTFVARA